MEPVIDPEINAADRSDGTKMPSKVFDLNHT